MNNLSTKPNAVADLLTFGFEAILRNSDAESISDWKPSFKGIGKITTPATKLSARYMQITLPFKSETGEPAGFARVDLHVYVKGSDLVFTNRCAIHLNGMTIMRGILGHEICGGASLDGKLNVLGNQHHPRDLVDAQLDAIGVAISNVLEALEVAFGPGFEPTKLWLKAGEACRDAPTINAISDVRVLQHSTIAGTMMRHWATYARTSLEEAGGVSTLRFVSQRDAPEKKVYAKRLDKRRHEIACSTRKKIVKLTGETSDDFTVEAAQRLVLQFLRAASNRLDRLEDHSIEALEGEASIIDVLISLKALVLRAMGEHKSKGPRSPDAGNVAKTALDAFFSVGWFDARNLHSRVAIRKDLDSLCDPEGPLVRHESRAIYYLKPAFARACAVIQMPWADDDSIVRS